MDPLTDPLTQGPITIIVPTAPNICLAVSDNITANLRVKQPSNIGLPSLYKRAYLIAYQTDEMAIVK